jgi:hypothetical protein
MMTLSGPVVMSRWPVMRVRVGATFRVQLLADCWIRLVTHFWGHTFLCPEGFKCDACEFLPPRPYWYLPALCLQTQVHSILELSASACSDLEQRCRFVGSAPRAGVQVEMSRKSPKSQIRLEVLGQETSPPTAQLWDWGTALMALYRLPPMHKGELIEQYGARVRATVASRANFMAKLYGEGGKPPVKGQW